MLNEYFGLDFLAFISLWLGLFLPVHSVSLISLATEAFTVFASSEPTYLWPSNRDTTVLEMEHETGSQEKRAVLPPFIS